MIRPETLNDTEIISSIHKEAFNPSENEAKVIKILRKTPQFNPQLSLIAFEEDEAVGHILFYPLTIEAGDKNIETLGLAPLGVKPKFQKKGYGSKLIEEGLKKARELGYTSVFVVGDPKYYGRFGFKPIDGIKDNRGFPKEVFQGFELVEGSLNGIKGTIIYPSEFDIIC